MLLIQFHALAIPGVLLLAFCVLYSYQRSRLTVRRAIRGLVGALLLAFLSQVVSTVLDYEVNPLSQWLVPSLCFGCVLAGIDYKKLRRDEKAVAGVLTFLIAFSGPFLSIEYLEIFQRGRFTGNPDYTRQLCPIQMKHNLKSLQKQLAEVTGQTDTDYPAGWLADSAVIGLLPVEMQAYDRKDSAVLSNDIVTYWHSWYTNIYGVQHRIEYGLWYPGGPLKAAIAQVSWKVRNPIR
ncbi:MAG TPA: hypothetical protein VKU00_24370 [Chthonomonadaceae bacterium]|nr:hypothetical protein [Chthonomonadaceae bacterium]